jgi:outer membrane protein assembly factor BamB/predicted Ser/Thr protein kinase
VSSSDAVDISTSTALTAEDPVEVGQYRVLRLLGEGGMGKVYLARSAGSRLVALKVIRGEYADDPGFRARFRREVQAAGRVSGFFTAAVVDADPDAHRPWLATSYLPAPSLREVVRRLGTLTEPALRALAAGLAEALVAIHAAGLVHRDLKPGNVLVVEDGPRVIDFGISRALDSTQLTRTGGILGTPGYMSPEQVASGRTVGPASDVFALGCVLVFAATGTNPYGPGDTAKVLYRVVNSPPNLDGVPAALVPLIEACLNKDPDGRPAVTALLAEFTPADPGTLISPPLRAELARRTEEAAGIASLPPEAFPRGRQEPPRPTVFAAAPKPSRRRFFGITAAAVATAAAGGAGFALLRSEDTPSAPAAPATVAAPRVPENPSPAWTQKLPAELEYGGLGIASEGLNLVGDTLVCWDKRNAFGFDAATGSPRWTAKPTLPADTSSFEWLGVRESILFGTARDHDTNTNLLFGLNARGEQIVNHADGPASITSDGYVRSTSFVALFDARDGVALVDLMTPNGWGVLAMDLRTGRRLWTRDFARSDTTAIADDQRCYVQEAATTYALDLRTGAQLWSAQNTSSGGGTASMAVDSGVVVVCGTRLVALDGATGAQRWTAVNQPTFLNKVTAAGGLVTVSNENTVWGISAQDGSRRWTTPSQLTPTGGGSTTSPGAAASAELIAIPALGPNGAIALRGSTGQLLWTLRDQSEEPETWTVLTTKDTIYAASPTTVHAFKDQR